MNAREILSLAGWSAATTSRHILPSAARRSLSLGHCRWLPLVVGCRHGDASPASKGVVFVLTRDTSVMSDREHWFGRLAGHDTTVATVLQPASIGSQKQTSKARKQGHKNMTAASSSLRYEEERAL